MASFFFFLKLMGCYGEAFFILWFCTQVPGPLGKSARAKSGPHRLPAAAVPPDPAEEEVRGWEQDELPA